MKGKKTKTLKSLKKQLRKALPEKVYEVIKSYDEFASHSAPVDAKGFSAHHSACKSAVVHAETLLKLAKWTDDDTEQQGSMWEEKNILSLLDEANSQLKMDDDINDELIEDE